MSSLPVVIVAAMARNRVIGDGDGLPWSIPSDLARFRALTVNKPVVMGRRTFEGLPRSLPFRDVFVVTRDPDWRFPRQVARHHVARSLGEAMAMAAVSTLASRAPEIVVAGGSEIYAQAMAFADRIELTLVDAEPEGTHHFPDMGPGWEAVHGTGPHRADGDGAPYGTVRYERRRTWAVAAE